MTTYLHPVTGVELNDITIRRTRLDDRDRATARQLRAEGDPRWLAAAKLGVHPLALDPAQGERPDRRATSGGHLSAGAAAQDARQSDFWEWPPEEATGQ